MIVGLIDLIRKVHSSQVGLVCSKLSDEIGLMPRLADLSLLWMAPTPTRIDVYETLCPQQMLVHKGGKIKNWGGECRDVTPTKSLSQNIRVDVNREVKFL